MNWKKYIKDKRVLLTILVLIIFLGGVWGYLHRPKESAFDDNAHAYDDPVRKGGSWTTGQLVVPGFSEVPVNVNDKQFHMVLGNSKLNKAYFKYKVQVTQSKKKVTILNSKLIKPGTAITEIATKKLTMKPGTYPMRITVSTYSLKNKKAPMNGSVIDAKLVIKE